MKVKHHVISIFLSLVLFFVMTCLYIVLDRNINITQPSNREIIQLGIGTQWLYNVTSHSNDYSRFAIVHPPLSGIVTALPLYLYGFRLENDFIYMNTNNQYDDMVSYLHAMKMPYIVGNEVISQANINKIDIYRFLRMPNITCVGITCIIILIFTLYITQSYNIALFSVITYVLLLLLNQNIQMTFVTMTSTNLLAMLLTASWFATMSMLSNPNYYKCSMIGVTIGGLYITADTTGMLFFCMVICANILTNDILQKQLSRGFKLQWVRYCLYTILIFLSIVWIGYGMYLAPPDEFITPFIFNITQNICKTLGCNITDIKIIPFDDNLRKLMYSVMFEDMEEKSSVCNVFNEAFQCNSIITHCSVLVQVILPQFGMIFAMLVVTCSILRVNILKAFAILHLSTEQQRYFVSSLILALFMLLSVVLYTDDNKQNIENFIITAVIFSNIIYIIMLSIILKFIVSLYMSKKSDNKV